MKLKVYNHKRQLIITFILGSIMGAGGMRYVYDHGIVQPDKVAKIKTEPKLSPVNYNPFDGSKSKSKSIDFIKNIELKDTNEICELQEHMSILGVYTGVIDGIPGKNTYSALRDSQKYFELPMTKDIARTILNKFRGRYRNISRYRNIINDNQSINISISKNPPHGKIFKPTSKRKVAPLRITTTKNTGDYLIKMEDKLTGKDELLFFVRGGEMLNIKVPLGKYVLKYANGMTWYSRNCLFGINTNYYEADKTFNFTLSGQRIIGYTVELILQRDGNLSTKKLNAQKW